ncbi:unnamed protein product [Arctogadus glacialis]
MRGSHPPSEIMGLTKEELEEEQEEEEEEEEILMCGHLSPYRLTLVTYDLFDTRPPLTRQHPNTLTPLLSNLTMR